MKEKLHVPNRFPNRVSPLLLKTGSLDNAIEEFSLALPSWYMSHYTMLYKYGKQTGDFWGVFILSLVYFSTFWGVGYLPSHIQCVLME